jgi:hypothetical protein
MRSAKSQFMSVPLSVVEVFAYNQQVNLNTINSQQIQTLSGTIFDDIFKGASITPFKTVIVDPLVLETFNIRYAEKQVIGIDENFSYYNVGYKIPQVALNPPIAARAYLTEKAFSGDVSGGIGESVFVYLLVDALQMNPDRIAHLRPEKFKKCLTPDFLVWEQNSDLSTLLNASYNPPLYAEVKSSTGPGNSDKISGGLEQLKAIMPLGSYGFMFLLYRRDPTSSYEGCLVKVEVV